MDVIKRIVREECFKNKLNEPMLGERDFTDSKKKHLAVEALNAVVLLIQ